MSDIQILTLKWWGFAKLLVVFARIVLSLQPADPRKALRQAQALEAYTYGALILLSRERQALDPQTEADQAAAAHLQSIHRALALLAVFASVLVQRLAAFVQQRGYVFNQYIPALGGKMYPPPVIDSS